MTHPDPPRPTLLVVLPAWAWAFFAGVDFCVRAWVEVGESCCVSGEEREDGEDALDLPFLVGVDWRVC
jgi:hypothetical protein